MGGAVNELIQHRVGAPGLGHTQPILVAILGPTATGKSALGIALASLPVVLLARRRPAPDGVERYAA